MLNIVIPMAGRGSRFANAGYSEPKPLIPVCGKPMIQLVVENLTPVCEHRFIFLVLREHIQQYSLDVLLRDISPNCEIIIVDGVTEGAACTVLLARKYINNDSPLMIANCDQWIDANINDYLQSMDQRNLDGLIMTMKANDPKWSFVSINQYNYVDRVVEKKVISNEATVGIYNFSHGAGFVTAADQMINNNERVNNEFYVAPTYNTLISQGEKIGIYNIGSNRNGMYGLGVPDDLDFFIDNCHLF